MRCSRRAKSFLTVFFGLICAEVILLIVFSRRKAPPSMVYSHGKHGNSTPVQVNRTTRVWTFLNHSYNYKEKTGCPTEPLHIVVLIMTRPTAMKNRQDIRKSWARVRDPNEVVLTVKFVAGVLSIPRELKRDLLIEHSHHGDLLLLDDLKDSYTSLPAKVVRGMKWVSDNLNFDYLMKTDDDMYVRVEHLSKTLQTMGCDELLYWGRFLCRNPDKKGRNKETNWHLCERYFPYGVGGGYVLAEKLVKFATLHSDRVRLYNNEDVTVGAMIAPFRTTRIYDSRFVTHGRKSCMDNFFVVNLRPKETQTVIQSRLSQNVGYCNASKLEAGKVKVHKMLSYLSADKS